MLKITKNNNIILFVITYIIYRKYFVCLNLEIAPVLDSDDMNDDDKDKIVKDETKKYQKKSEEKTSKQDVRHFI